MKEKASDIREGEEFNSLVKCAENVVFHEGNGGIVMNVRISPVLKNNVLSSSR